MEDPISLATRLAQGTYTITDFTQVQHVLKVLAEVVMDQQRRIQKLEGPARPSLRKHELSRPVSVETGKPSIPLT